MPYIQQDQRSKWEETINSLVIKVGSSSKRLAYLFTLLANKIATPKNYANFEKAFGYLNCVRYEYNRRVAFIRRGLGSLILAEKFDCIKESQQIDTIFVHGVDKDKQGGHLNFVASSVINRLLGDYDFEKEDIDEILEAVIDMYYIKIIGPYEDQKIQENGDVYSSDLTTLI